MENNSAAQQLMEEIDSTNRPQSPRSEDAPVAVTIPPSLITSTSDVGPQPRQGRYHRRRFLNRSNNKKFFFKI